MHERISGDEGRAWVARLPELAASSMERWNLVPDGPTYHGMVSLVLPVRRVDGTPAALKLQPYDHETVGEPIALREWNGDGTVRLLEADGEVMLLERLAADRSLNAVEDVHEALRILAELLARLCARPAPAQLRRLADIAGAMVTEAPQAATAVSEGDRFVVSYCAGAVAELLDEPGDRLLHWDLHYENVLAGEREPWLVIDPKPLAGDPGFELLPSLHNRWDEIVATGDIGRAVRRRFDQLVDVLGLDRQRALGWTLGRILQNALWDIEDGEPEVSRVQVAIFEALTGLSTRD
jgi:streptomycin 6-kinase